VAFSPPIQLLPLEAGRLKLAMSFFPSWGTRVWFPLRSHGRQAGQAERYREEEVGDWQDLIPRLFLSWECGISGDIPGDALGL
jgi:hypothetical protein